jgi:branched-chain amino acid transport system ATP-binding protein
MKETLLELKDVSVHYGGIRALDGVDVSVDEGEIVALMGPNGAGKSTVIKAMFGLAPLAHGEVRWHGTKLAPVPYEMAGRGIAYVPQGRQVFKNLTVLENLQLGGYGLQNRRDIDTNIESVLKIFPALKEKLYQKAGLLSGGQQQMLTIARGLVSDPKALLLDEPSLGLAPKIVKEVFELIKEINTVRNIAILVVEHSIKSVLDIADRAYVLSRGKVAIHKKDGEELSDEQLERVFLS